MSESPNSQTTSEEPADLSLNQDEAMDLHLGLGALGGLRHSRACDAAQRSQQRYDDRQHRLHESRMTRLGMEGEESPEDEDMSQQVLIRSPVTHHHHYDQQPAQQQPTQPEQPSEADPAWKTWLKRAAIASLPLAGVGGVLAYDALTGPTEQPPAVEQPYDGSYMQYHMDVIPPEGGSE